MGSSMIHDCVITWLHPTAFHEASHIDELCGYWDHNDAWFKSQFQETGVFAMGAYDHHGLLLGWALHRRTHQSHIVKWIAVRPESQLSGVGTALMNRFKVWIDNDPDRMQVEIQVPEENVTAQVFLRKIGYVCKPPNGSSLYHFTLTKKGIWTAPKSSQ